MSADNKRSVQGVIFDVDGVLVNTETIHFKSFKQVLQNYNYNLTKVSYQKHFSGKSIRGGLLSLLSEAQLVEKSKVELFVQSFSREKITLTEQLFKTELTFYNDSLEFLKRVRLGSLRLKGIGKLAPDPVIAYCTGLEKSLMDIILDRGKLHGLFDIQVNSDDYHESKPDPECYQVALSKMKLSGSSVIGIEDSPAGLMALSGAGVFSIGLSKTHSRRLLGVADYIVESLIDLIHESGL